VDRRSFLVGMGGLLALPRFALAQQSGRTYRIGILDSTGRRTEPYYVAFDQRLREPALLRGAIL